MPCECRGSSDSCKQMPPLRLRVCFLAGSSTTWPTSSSTSQCPIGRHSPGSRRAMLVGFGGAFVALRLRASSRTSLLWMQGPRLSPRQQSRCYPRLHHHLRRKQNRSQWQGLQHRPNQGLWWCRRLFQYTGEGRRVCCCYCFVCFSFLVLVVGCCLVGAVCCWLVFLTRRQATLATGRRAWPPLPRAGQGHARRT